MVQRTTIESLICALQAYISLFNFHSVSTLIMPTLQVRMLSSEGWVQKNWCFLTVVLEKTLESPLESREIKPGNFLKEIHPEGLMLKLKLQYFGHLMQRADSLEKILMVRKIEGRRRGRQKMRWLDGITDSSLGVGDGQGSLRAAVHGVPKGRTWLSNWNELNGIASKRWAGIWTQAAQL